MLRLRAPQRAAAPSIAARVTGSGAQSDVINSPVRDIQAL